MAEKDTSIELSSGERPTFMTPLSKVMERLRVRKYDQEFKWTSQGFTINRGKFYQPQDLLIVRVYRFEGESDPADESILYVIQAYDGLIGFSLDMYGIYSNHQDEEGYDEFMRRIPVADRPEQIIAPDGDDLF
jgi:hypothetical protein